MLALALFACAPDAPPAETCDGRDEDRDGVTDEGLTRTFYADLDGDGYGTEATARAACAAPEGYAPASGDCDDGDPAAHPGATESCATAADDDCDGVANPDGAAGCVGDWPDTDGDGLGEGDPACVCAPTGVATGGDCDGADVDRGADCAEGAAETLAGDRLDLDDADAYWSLLGAGDFGDEADSLALVSTDGRFSLTTIPAGVERLSDAARLVVAAATWTRPRLGDLDGDGAIDLLAPTGAIEEATLTPTLGVTFGPLLAAGAATPYALEPLDSASATESLVVGDLDGDGAPEAWYALGTAGTAGQVGAWRVDADGATPLATPGAAVADALTRLAGLGDVDGDGLDDLGVYAGGALALHSGPLGALPAPGDAAATVEVPALDDVVALGDIDDDGLADVGLREARIWVLTTFGSGALVDVARARIGPESDAEGDAALFVAAGDVGADGARDLLVSDTFWPWRTGAGNLRGALYVFAGAPSGVVDARAAERRIYAEDYALFGAFPTVLADGRIAVGSPLYAGEGSLGAVWVIDG